MSKAKITRGAATGNATGLLEAFDELRRAIEIHARNVPTALHEAMAAVVEEIDALRAADLGDEASRPLSTAAAWQAALTPQRSRRGENHDAKRPPAGYRYKDGWLLGPPFASKEPDPTTEPAARSVIQTIACWFSTPEGAPFPFLESVSAMGKYTLKRITPDQERAVHEAYEAVFGEPFGRPRWRRALVGQLEMNAYHREMRRLQGAHGHPDRMAGPIHSAPPLGQNGAMFGPADGTDILKAIEATAPPAELTAAVVDEMIAKVGLNPGGRGGKKIAASVVDEFAQKLEAAKHH